MPLIVGLAEALKRRELLLVLDNFEHLMSATDLVGQLLAAAPGLDVLVTSRESLRIRGEHRLEVGPMPLEDAAELFLERARAIRSDLEHGASDIESVKRVCMRLDRLPLALELAAAWLTMFGVGALEERLAQRLSISARARDLPDRQRTLRAAIDWSYRLLSPSEQALFRGLSVFAGGARLEAIESVLVDSASDPVEIVRALVEKSLLRRQDDRDGQPRFWMLETIRQYAAERSAVQRESSAVASRHAVYFAGLADQAKPHLRTAEQSVGLARLEADDDNLRGALDHLTVIEPSRALRMAAALGRFWEIRSRHTEGRERLRRILQFSSSDYRATANATNSAGRLAVLQGDTHEAELLFLEALRLARVVHEPLAEVLALGMLGSCAELRGEIGRGIGLYEEALAAGREADDDQSLAVALGNLGFAVANIGGATGETAEIKRGEALLEEALLLSRRLGDTMNTAASAANLAECALARGDLSSAEPLIAETLQSFREIDHRSGIGWAVALDALLALRRGDPDAAHARFSKALEFGGDYDIHTAQFALSVAAAIAAERGHSLLAAELWGALDEMRARGDPEPFTATRLREEWLPVAHRCVDARAWDAAWAAGVRLSPDQALEVAAKNVALPVVAHPFDGQHSA